MVCLKLILTNDTREDCKTNLVEHSAEQPNANSNARRDKSKEFHSILQARQCPKTMFLVKPKLLESEDKVETGEQWPTEEVIPIPKKPLQIRIACHQVLVTLIDRWPHGAQDSRQLPLESEIVQIDYEQQERNRTADNVWIVELVAMVVDQLGGDLVAKEGIIFGGEIMDEEGNAKHATECHQVVQVFVVEMPTPSHQVVVYALVVILTQDYLHFLSIQIQTWLEDD